MRALLKQTISRLQADYVVLHGGEAIYNIRVPFSVYPLNIEICDSKGPLYTVKSTIVGAAPVTQSQMYRILSSLGSEEGQVARRRNYLNVTRAATYDMFFSGHEYTAYEIGAWRDGMYYPIYDGEQQVAMIHKGTKVHGNLDEYELYALEQKGMLAAVIYASYLDVLKYRNIGEFSKHKVQVKYAISLSKKTRALLDKSFMDRC